MTDLGTTNGGTTTGTITLSKTNALSNQTATLMNSRRCQFYLRHHSRFHEYFEHQLGYGINIGTGAASGSNFAIYCGMLVQTDGYPGGYGYTGEASHLVFDRNNIPGCIPLVNWYGEEGTSAWDLVLTNFTNIGFDRETELSAEFWSVQATADRLRQLGHSLCHRLCEPIRCGC